MKLKTSAAEALPKESLVEKSGQRASMPAPSWQAKRVEPLMVVLSDRMMRLKGGDSTMLRETILAATRAPKKKIFAKCMSSKRCKLNLNFFLLGFVRIGWILY